ncbi:MAG: adenine deaminase [Clostridiales bacterium]|nr:MAG: adenine deaminase [Clostridiales bacterium]
MENLIPTALGREKADLVLKNANIIDVFCQRIIKNDVAIKNGMIAGIGEYEGLEEIDCSEKFVMPSFVDSHVHIESSMVSPAEYAKAVVARGVTCVVCDPHEIANVCGEDGLEFMINSAKTVPLDTFFMLPSCVPATPIDSSGAFINAEKAEEIKNRFPEFKGIAEMMNVPGVLGQDKDVIKKLSLFDICDGHAPMLSNNELNAYIAAGIKSDHECVTAGEAIEKVSKGMYVHIREGTGAKNLKEIIKAVTPLNMHRFTFCTDDKHADEIIENGTIQNCVCLACKNGLNPITAITIASLNARMCYGMKNAGAIAPGYKADFIICDELIPKNIISVYKNGKLVAENGKALFKGSQTESLKVENTVNVADVNEEDFHLPFTGKETVIEIHDNTLVTTVAKEYTAEGLNLCAVIERHKKTGQKGMAFVKGFKIKNGAIAQTIGHDSHNIVVVGDCAKNMNAAVHALGTEGGIVVIEDGKIAAKLTLEIAGIMTKKSLEDVALGNSEIIKAAKRLNPELTSSRLMILSFISLIVIPEIKLCDKGLFDVINWKFIE